MRQRKVRHGAGRETATVTADNHSEPWRAFEGSFEEGLLYFSIRVVGGSKGVKKGRKLSLLPVLVSLFVSCKNFSAESLLSYHKEE